MSEAQLSFRGVVQRIVSHGGSAGVIFLVEPINSAFRDLTKIKLNANVQSKVPALGEVWDITGAYDDDTSCGGQIIAEEAFPVLPSDHALVEFIGKNPKFAGIGIRTAQKMWMAFGDELYDILTQKNEQLLLSRVNLNDALLEILFEAWEEYERVIPVVRFFHGLGFNAKLANKAVELWGNETVEKIKEDPYRLLAFGGWGQVDAAARRKLNVLSDAEMRLIAAVEEALYRAYEDKHTAQDYQSLLTHTEQLLGVPQVAERAIKLALADGRVQALEDANRGSLYQIASAAVMERYIRNRIAGICQGENHQTLMFQRSVSDKRLVEFEAKLTYRLTEEQRLAIKMVVEQPFAVIVGGAGVGKTTVLRGIYHVLPENAIIIQAALTNHAASRMSVSTGKKAISIAKLLFSASENNLPESAYFFIDDASMLDMPTFYRICKALPVGSRLCLIGDQHQLPPIGPGLVLHQLVKEGYPHITELTKVHRQPNETGITIVAEVILNKVMPSLEQFVSGKSKGFGVSIYPTYDTSTLIEDVLAAYREFDHNGEAQIVAAQLETCLQINQALHLENKAYREYGKQETHTLFANDSELCVGDKIAYIGHDDLTRKLFNGSLGVITRIYANPVCKSNDSRDLEIVVAEAKFDSAETIQITEDDLKYINLGYAITAHKAQNSRWERVVIVSEFVEKLNPIVDNTWFYTAVTRCEKQAVIVGSQANFLYQVAKPPRAFSRVIGLTFKAATEVL
ncbi:MAG: AAA family ATPase [Methylotenera sp.]|nr:AAA family ATPase [Methylotenera sp.]